MPRPSSSRASRSASRATSTRSASCSTSCSPRHRRTGCAATPTSRSAMRKALAGDLDTIVLAAIKPSPDDRYATANAFADDLSRFLDGYPITARPDSAWYRVRKLVMRNRVAAAALAAVVLALAGGVSAALWQARRATDEQHRAEQVAGYLTGMLRDASPYGAAGRSPSVVELLKRAH